VIEGESFEKTKLKKLVIPASLQYVGARICPATTELLLTGGAKMPMFKEWKVSFVHKEDHVMGIQTRNQMRDWKRGWNSTRRT
jgi:hypothetical protein